MKIATTPEPLRPDRLKPATGETRVASSPPGQGAAEADALRLPEMSRRLSELETRFSGDYDARKVVEVREAMAAGHFKVNVEAVADRLLASVGELLGRKA